MPKKTLWIIIALFLLSLPQLSCTKPMDTSTNTKDSSLVQVKPYGVEFSITANANQHKELHPSTIIYKDTDSKIIWLTERQGNGKILSSSVNLKQMAILYAKKIGVNDNSVHDTIDINGIEAEKFSSTFNDKALVFYVVFKNGYYYMVGVISAEMETASSYSNLLEDELKFPDEAKPQSPVKTLTLEDLGLEMTNSHNQEVSTILREKSVGLVSLKEKFAFIILRYKFGEGASPDYKPSKKDALNILNSSCSNYKRIGKYTVNGQ